MHYDKVALKLEQYACILHLLFYVVASLSRTCSPSGIQCSGLVFALWSQIFSLGFEPTPTKIRTLLPSALQAQLPELMWSDKLEGKNVFHLACLSGNFHGICTPQSWSDSEDEYPPLWWVPKMCPKVDICQCQCSPYKWKSWGTNSFAARTGQNNEASCKQKMEGHNNPKFMAICNLDGKQSNKQNPKYARWAEKITNPIDF